MKILHVNTNDTGGAAIAAKRLHLLLLKHGIESRMLFLKRSGKVKIPEVYYMEDLYGKIPFKLFDKLNTLYNRRFSFTKASVYFNGPDSLFDISKHPAFAWADVVHLHWVVKLLDWQSVFKHKDKKFVWTLHDMNPFTGGEHYKTGYNGEFGYASKRNIAVKKAAIQHEQIQIICPSEWLSGIARQSEVFKHQEVRTMRNPIDNSVFSLMDKVAMKQKHGLDPNKKNILFVAENPHDERKGFKYLLEALPQLNKDEIEVSVIGKTDQIEDQLSQINAHCFGTINDETTMVELYNAADVFVIPSLEDNLPNTVSEALLCGTAVSGMRIGGIQEMVSDGVNGYLSSSPESLGEAINKTLSLNLSATDIRQNALKELEEKQLMGSFEAMYRDLMGH